MDIRRKTFLPEVTKLCGFLVTDYGCSGPAYEERWLAIGGLTATYTGVTFSVKVALNLDRGDEYVAVAVFLPGEPRQRIYPAEALCKAGLTRPQSIRKTAHNGRQMLTALAANVDALRRALPLILEKAGGAAAPNA